jgi:hypothetical protein
MERRHSIGYVCGVPIARMKIYVVFIEVLKERVRSSGFEPPRYFYRQPLKLVRLPIPPRPRCMLTSRLQSAKLGRGTPDFLATTKLHYFLGTEFGAGAGCC